MQSINSPPMHLKPGEGRPLVVRDEFGAEVAAEYAQLVRLAEVILRNQADAQDAVQNALCRAFERRHQLRGDSLRPWLRRIMANEALAMLRMRRSAPAHVALDPLCSTLPDGAVTTEAILLQREAVARVLHTARSMPDPYRSVLVRVASGETLPEMVQSLSASMSAVKVRLCRARRELRRSLRAAWGSACVRSCPPPSRCGMNHGDVNLSARSVVEFANAGQ